MILKAKTKVYEITPDELKGLFARELECNTDMVAVDFVIREVGGDPFDRFPGPQKVVAIKITQSES